MIVRTLAALMLLLAGVLPVAAGEGGVAERVMKLTRGTVWKQVAAIPIAFPTFHPQAW